MVVYNNILAGASGATGAAAGFQIERSLRFNSDDDASLSKTFSAAGNRKKWTWSAWIKRCKFGVNQRVFSGISGSGSNDNYMSLLFDTDDTFRIGLWTSYARISNAVFRDSSAWYHFCVAADLDNSDDDLKLRAYVNGSEISWTSTSTNPSTSGINGTGVQSIGADTNGTSNPCDIYLADVHFIDGQALAPTDFGEYDDNNVWQPKGFTSFDNPNNGTTWSDAVPTADGFRPGRAHADGFDGDLSTYVAINNTTFNLDVGSWNLTGTVEVYTGANMQYAVDGGSASSMTADDWTNVGDAGSITTLTFTRTDSNYPYFYAIRVGGYVLIDDSGDNSFKLNFSDNSSNAALGYDAAVTPTLNAKGSGCRYLHRYWKLSIIAAFFPARFDLV